VLSPGAVADLGPEFRRQAELLLDQVLTKRNFDAHTEIANVYPLKVFGDALGIDSDDRELLLVFGDPRKFNDLDAYDIKRNFSGHLGFDRGVHTCVGMHVAKPEAEHLLQVFVERVKSVSLTGEPKFKLNNTVCGPSALPISVELA